MKYCSHRGGVYYTPENTMPAFYDAFEKGIDYIETDPRYTKDGKIVLMHDVTINRTCVNPDGSEIEVPIEISEHSYEELLYFDAGLRKGEQFKGTKIPLLEELLKAAEGKEVIILLDKKIKTNQMVPLFDLIERFNTKVAFSVEDIERIDTILSRFPDALINYDGPSTEEMIKQVITRVKPENLLIWMYLDKPNFHWLESTRKVSVENCERVKRYAKLGIANINNPYDIYEALAYKPDVLEI